VDIGEHVRDFTAITEQGEPWTLYDHVEDGPVVLFFYPKAKTPL